MLVLLIIFMVITPMLSKGVQVDMYKAHNTIAMQDADKEDAVIVAVTRNGDVYLSPGNKKTTSDALPQKVRDLVEKRANKTVYIRADSRARYEKVEDVVDNLRAAGIDQIGLLTEQLPQKEGGKTGAGG
jgi:biopolymer transport protein ExbD/biopolymer transport protein TolR